MSIINSIKKNDSVYNKQMLIVDSRNKLINENSSSFSNTLITTATRVVKLEVLDANIHNTIYNINNNKTILDIETRYLNDETVNKKLIVDDTEIKNNEISTTNELNLSINEFNLITSNNVIKLIDLNTNDLNIIITGKFNNNLITFNNLNNIYASNLIHTNSIDNIFVCKYNIDQQFNWRLKIGNCVSCKTVIYIDHIYVLIKANIGSIEFYDIEDTLINTENMVTNGFILCKYDFYGTLIWKLPSYQNDASNIDNLLMSIDSEKIAVSGTFKDYVNAYFYDVGGVIQDNPIVESGSSSIYTFIIAYDLNGNYIEKSLSYLNNINNVYYNSTTYGITKSWSSSYFANELIGIALSSDSTIQTAISNSIIYITNDSGLTWVENNIGIVLTSVAISKSINVDGKYQTAVGTNSQIYRSDDYGITWNPVSVSNTWISIAMSYDGIYQTAIATGSRVYRSDDYGITWNIIATTDVNLWSSVSISETGEFQTATSVNTTNISDDGYIYKSVDYGITWIKLTSIAPTSGNNDWTSVSISATGQYQTAAANKLSNRYLYTSNDYGVTWVANSDFDQWTSVSISTTGQYQIAVSTNFIYISNDYGITWVYSNVQNSQISKPWLFCAIDILGNNQICLAQSSSNPACEIVPTSLVIYANTVYLSTNFDTIVKYKNYIGKELLTNYISISEGIVNTSVNYYQFDNQNILSMVGSISVISSFTVNNCKISVDSTGIVLIANFDDIIKFYNDTGSIIYTASPVKSGDKNIFIASMSLSVSNLSTINYVSTITSETEIVPKYLLIDSGLVYISCIFKDNIKFYQYLNGYDYIEGGDIPIANTISNKYSQFIAVYTTTGLFQERIYNNNSGENIAISYNTNIYSINNLNATESNQYYNSKNELDPLINSTDNIGILMSYNTSNLVYTLDYNTLDNAILSAALVNDEIGIILNINSFSETLGFEKNQKFIASVFGTSVSWNTVDISITNPKITIGFNIANKNALKFDYFEVSFTTSIYTLYNPYNLIYELNKIFNTIKKNISYINQAQTTAFYYNRDKKIFYARFDIDGSFSVLQTNLSNEMNLPNTKSNVVVISDLPISEIDNLIIDKTKLSIKLTDDTLVNLINNSSFNETFPGVSSNTITMSAVDNVNMTALCGSTVDELDNINPDTIVTIKSNFLPNRFIKFNPKEISMSSDGSIQTAIENIGGLWTSADGGNTWNKNKSAPDTQYWHSIDMSSDGQYQTAVLVATFGTPPETVWKSVDYGNIWTGQLVVGNSSEPTIAMSSDGSKQTITQRVFGIVVSVDYGNTWIADTSVGSAKAWVSVAMSATGKIQTAVVTNGNIWTSNDYGITWVEDTSIGLFKTWASVDMSADGVIQTAVANFDHIWQSNDSGITWVQNLTTGGSKYWSGVSVSDDGIKQIACIEYSRFWVSTDSGTNWIENVVVSSQQWISIKTSGDGLTHAALTRNGPMWKFKNSDPWVKDETAGSSISFDSLCMSAIGKIQLIGSFQSYLLTSSDYGNTWVEVTSVGEISVSSVSMSWDGQIQMAPVYGGKIWKSIDYGVTWIEKATVELWYSIDMSADGQIQLAGAANLWLSLDFGETWSEILTAGATTRWTDIAISSDGTQLIAVSWIGIWYSNNTGTTWTEDTSISPSAFRKWTSVYMSSNGLIRTITSNYSDMYNTSDAGITWVKNTLFNTVSMANGDMSSDGVRQVLVSYGGNIWKSNDSGVTWVEDVTNGNQNWDVISISANGNVQTAIVYDGNIFTNSFTDVEISLSVISVNESPLKITFHEIAKPLTMLYNAGTNAFEIGTENNYTSLNNLDLSLNNIYSITNLLKSQTQDLFITPGKYSITEFIAQVNSQIHTVNSSFYRNGVLEPFTYNTITQKVTFNPYYTGAKSVVLDATYLLNAMGITTLPNFISGPITGSNAVGSHLLGNNTLYIKSNVINKYMKENTASGNYKFNNVIATLKYSSETDSYKIVDSDKNEVYLSQKIDLTNIDIQIMNEDSEIVNLNGGNVDMRIKLIKS
jgi:uncharacterized protein YkuJ